MSFKYRVWFSPTLWAIVFASTEGFAQTNPLPLTNTYVLLEGSRLIDCPICDRLPTEYPMRGSFLLTQLESNPLFTSYELKGIFFQAGTNNGPHYKISGNGTYRVGGEVAYQQDLGLNLTIDYRLGQAVAFYSNYVRSVKAPWPVIDAVLDQLDASVFPNFQLHMIAAPMPQFIAIVPQTDNGDVRLEWQASGQPVQLERAESVEGPYVPLTVTATNQTFLDKGILTNRAQSYYRLRQVANGD